MIKSIFYDNQHNFIIRIFRITAFWLLSSILIHAIFTFISIIYWYITYDPESGVNWDPLDDILGVFAMIPWGWSLSIIFPYSLISLCGLFLGIFINSLKPLIISLLYAAIFGWMWPYMFVAMMGV